MRSSFLSKEKAERFIHHLALPEIGEGGQTQLGQSSVLIVGLGGLGAANALLLASAGFGRLGLVDFDSINLSNLPRQVLYRHNEIGSAKVMAARESLLERNQDILIDVYKHPLNSENAGNLIAEYDIVVDGTDNLATRSLINRNCVEFNKPFVFGAVEGFDGQVSVLCTNQGPCLSCLYPESGKVALNHQLEHHQVISTLPTMISAIQSTETIKLLLGIGDPLIGRLLLINALRSDFNTVKVEKKLHCPICG
jgi:adenylyltransferase/sulfurtransferase